jgi:leader peptidase (prepilin peptidase)/N-methyltransferase
MSFLYYFLPGLLAGLLVDMAVRRLASSHSRFGRHAGRSTYDAPLAGETGSASAAAFERRLWQRAALVLGTALLIGVVGLRYDNPAQAAIVAVYVVVLLTCTGTDLITFRIPNAVTYPAIVIALVAATLAPEGDLNRAAAGGGLAGGFMLALAIVSRGGLGLGDVKLAAFIGFALGTPLIFPALFLMGMLGGLTAAALLLLRLRGRGDPMPYGPILAAAALAILLWQGNASFTL